MDSSKYAPANKHAAPLSPTSQKEANLAASKAAAQRIMENVNFDSEGDASYVPAQKSTPAHPAPPIMEAAPAEETMRAMEAAAPVVGYDENQFAQTVDEDDLFADDFEPLAEPTVEEPTAPAAQSEEVVPTAPSPRASRQTKPDQPAKQPVPSKSNATTKSADPANGRTQSTDGTRANRGTAAVRGDRSLTGGKARTKLTEEELAAKMEAIKLNNAKLEESHARAAADEASFRAAEQAARELARKERQERQAMMGEREKNAARKLKAMQSRDWDKEKREQELRSGSSRRGANGGIVGGAPSRGIETWLNDQATHAGLTKSADDFMVTTHSGRYGASSRGRGRGRGVGGGRGLKSKASMPAILPSGQQKIPKQEEFPPLPVKSWAEDE